MSRIPFTPKQRFEILSRDGFACQYCGGRAPNVQLVVDHVVPVSRGGTNDPSNLVAACFSCNAGKATSIAEVHRLFGKIWFVVADLPSRIKEVELRVEWSTRIATILLGSDYEWALLRELHSRKWVSWDEWYGYACALVVGMFSEEARSSCPELAHKRLDLPFDYEDPTGGEDTIRGESN